MTVIPRVYTANNNSDILHWSCCFVLTIADITLDFNITGHSVVFLSFFFMFLVFLLCCHGRVLLYAYSVCIFPLWFFLLFRFYTARWRAHFGLWIFCPYFVICLLPSVFQYLHTYHLAIPLMPVFTYVACSFILIYITPFLDLITSS